MSFGMVDSADGCQTQKILEHGDVTRDTFKLMPLLETECQTIITEKA